MVHRFSFSCSCTCSCACACSCSCSCSCACCLRLYLALALADIFFRFLVYFALALDWLSRAARSRASGGKCVRARRIEVLFSCFIACASAPDIFLRLGLRFLLSLLLSMRAFGACSFLRLRLRLRLLVFFCYILTHFPWCIYLLVHLNQKKKFICRVYTPCCDDRRNRGLIWCCCCFIIIPNVCFVCSRSFPH
jgi:hypothetical protein